MSEPTVAPRARAPESGASLPLVDLVAPYLDGDRPGCIAVLGPYGVGKTTALEVLARRWPDVEYLDEPARLPDAKRCTVYASEIRLHKADGPRFELAPWTGDEILDHVLARFPDHAGSLMTRARAAADRELLGGSPELWTAVLDAWAADESFTNVCAALCAAFSSGIRAGGVALWMKSSGRLPADRLQRMLSFLWTEPRQRLLRHDPVLVALGAAELARRLRATHRLHILGRRLDPDVIDATGLLVATDGAALASLRRAARTDRTQATAAGLLHAAGAAWRPEAGAQLSYARLPGVAWPGVDLTGANLQAADFAGADLTEACLDGADAERAGFVRARFHGASLAGLAGWGAVFAHADLSSARAAGVDLRGARLTGANAECARFEDADLEGADLGGVRFARSILRGANLARARIAGADFAGACLDGANLCGLSLRRAHLAGATFAEARLAKADLAQVRLPGAAMRGARLDGADLTRAHMPDACFTGATFRGAGLGHVHWERADLRDADLRGASFHLGSSRSGLVDSVVPCEGSRTGYYTDEAGERHFRAPEEIRKANLRGADLRGARLDDTDFYLVDLRDARYDAAQARLLRASGAILGARAR